MATKNPRVWFKSISLENVRSFGTKQIVYFTQDGTANSEAAQWNVILGDNGTGKTTVLRSMCLAVAYRFNIHIRFNLLSLLRDDFSSDVSCELWNSGSGRVQNIRFNPTLMEGIASNFVVAVTHSDGESIMNVHDDLDISPTLFAYGAARRIREGPSSDDLFFNFRTLFEENATLVNAEEWLVQSEYVSLREPLFRNRFDIVLTTLKGLFSQEVSDIYIDTKTGKPKVFFKTHYGDVRLHELSLGYKTLIAWMVDFAKGLLDRYPDSPDPLAEPAVCLVDEIDLHLHPKFQRTIIKFLTETFPHTQFIVTAHSPLIVQSAEDANIVVLRREGNETVVDANRVDVHDWRIDQILSSDLFGGIGGRSPEVEEKIRRRRALLRKNELIGSEKTELATLEQELGNLPVSESREALKALDIISQSLISQS